jgi:hypothetical protein
MANYHLTSSQTPLIEDFSLTFQSSHNSCPNPKKSDFGKFLPSFHTSPQITAQSHMPNQIANPTQFQPITSSKNPISTHNSHQPANDHHYRNPKSLTKAPNPMSLTMVTLQSSIRQLNGIRIFVNGQKLPFYLAFIDVPGTPL